MYPLKTYIPSLPPPGKLKLLRLGEFCGMQSRRINWKNSTGFLTSIWTRYLRYWRLLILSRYPRDLHVILPWNVKMWYQNFCRSSSDIRYFHSNCQSASLFAHTPLVSLLHRTRCHRSLSSFFLSFQKSEIFRTPRDGDRETFSVNRNTSRNLLVHRLYNYVVSQYSSYQYYQLYRYYYVFFYYRLLIISSLTLIFAS